ncbi:NAD(+) diphosphatase [Endozoicomonas sp. 4G]|uniref:NAD(+) diphosphatase n=1 Tax=Endozoicomonas sp. 4G TaxID=2872754 RepID=UPI00207876E9|nr:NAD(+) diphosphatase [Endozoicomonas sp. 4G]
MHQYQPAGGWISQDDLADRFLILIGDDILMNSEGGFLWEKRPWMDGQDAVRTGNLDQYSVSVIKTDTVLEESPEKSPKEGSVVNARHYMATQPESMVAFYSHAVQILRSRRDHRFCGRCGHPCRPGEGDWAMVCSVCEMSYYPRISPCIIVLIHKGNEVLLVKHRRHLRNTTMHTVIAGFIEPGETAEAAVIREIREEVGLEVGEVKYQLSQSWPFPHALMLGYHAEYKSGDICLEEEELVSAQWFRRDALPDLPPEFTISRKLIDL